MPPYIWRSCLSVTDGQVVRAGVSVTWNVLSWSGGHEFEPQSGGTWGAWYFCPKSYLNQNTFSSVMSLMHFGDHVFLPFPVLCPPYIWRSCLSTFSSVMSPYTPEIMYVYLFQCYIPHALWRSCMPTFLSFMPPIHLEIMSVYLFQCYVPCSLWRSCLSAFLILIHMLWCTIFTLC